MENLSHRTCEGEITCLVTPPRTARIDNTGVFMTDHVTPSPSFFTSSVSFFATRLAIGGLGGKQKLSEAQRRHFPGPYHANLIHTNQEISFPSVDKMVTE